MRLFTAQIRVEGGKDAAGISLPNPGMQIVVWRLARLTTIWREELGDVEFETLAAQGRAMTIEQAIAYALEDQD